MSAVSIFDLTDGQVDAIVAARKTTAPKYDTELYDRIAAIRATYERAVVSRAEEQAIRQTRHCTRCGIDTRRPDLCRDCEDAVMDLGELDRWAS